MSGYVYHDLDFSRSEIRILRFLNHNPSEPSVVRCTLSNVSLDDLLPGYLRFFEATQPVTPAEATQRWLEADFSQTFSAIPEKRPVIAASRYSTNAWDGIRRPEGLLALCDAQKDPAVVPIVPRFTWGDFEAISYCWESDVRNTTVFVDDYVVPIPENLHAALLRIQRLPEAQTDMGFWIDGLCIDQSNLLEKNHQVNLMKRIYSQALSTIVWLGPSKDDSDEAMDAIQEGFFTLQETWNGPESLSGNLWASILAIWSRNYFKRMWIIQELALNKTLSLFICGNREVSRSQMSAACRFAQNCAGSIARAVLTADPHQHRPTKLEQGHVWREAYSIENLLNLSVAMDLDITLDLARKSKVTDPRDKIYGLLGMLPDDMAAGIEPDYTKVKSEVYIEFAILLLSRCDRLDEILAWRSSTKDAGLPSWVPDWTTAFERFHVRWLRKRHAGGDQKPNWTLWYECTESANLPTPLRGLELRLEGILLDSIDCISNPSHCNRPYRTVIQSISQADSTVSGFGRYGDSQRMKAALSRILVLDHPARKPAGDLTDIHWLDWDLLNMEDAWHHPFEAVIAVHDGWRYFDAFRHSNANFPVFGQPLKQLFPNLGIIPVELGFINPQSGIRLACLERPDVPDLTSEHCDNIGLAYIALSGRRLITTCSGYLGLVPDDTEAGDTLAVILGCNYPVVLRRCNGGYRYIGECYIDGLMDGEAVEAADRGDYQVEEIIIM